MDNSKNIVTCTYCNQPARLLKVKRKKIWKCFKCKAATPCSYRSNKPVGTFANKALLRARNRAHKALDSIISIMTKHYAYLWLSVRLQISSSECHIAKFDYEQCQKVVSLCEEVIKPKTW